MSEDKFDDCQRCDCAVCRLDELFDEMFEEEGACWNCENFMIEVHNDGEGDGDYHCTSRFACFIDRKEVKPFQPACKQYEKRVN